ncbi:hypothetical protein KSP39_PZI019081 [Platanthera zijinensis]|uniref:C3H1-type domain-containing protein n=1 Tax=Platanthera zijinensis TaxID=2320716 RepID=A0AAP0B239_9ASPA
MPDSREFLNNALSTSSGASPENHNLNESMHRLDVEDHYEEVDGYSNPYPLRPSEPDCIYYMKTGSCGYGSICRYNHPTYVGQGTLAKGELPERVGQPDCQYFLKTGMCKFGATCKYHHPRDRHDARTTPLNILGFPMRQDEKSCSYYMRTGACKFGVACKFNHPQPATVGAVYPLTGSSAYGSTLSSVTPPSMPLAGGISAWPLPNRPPYIPNPRVQSLPAYMPVILPPTPGAMPVQQGWTTYTGTISHTPSSDILGHSQTPKSKNNLYLSPGSIENFPERPDQPECQYYLKTGSCKYGPTCKYHHPRDRNSSAMGTLGPLGFPLRPGQSVCSFYSMYGSCRYGSACRFDHPVIGYYNYPVSAISAPDHLGFGVFTNQRSQQLSRIPMDSASPKITKSEVRDAAPPSDRDEYQNRPARASTPPHTALLSDSLLNHQSD